MKKTEKYAVLEHLHLPSKGLRFWSNNTEDNIHGHTGEIWYKEILLTDKEDEAIDVASKNGNLPTQEELMEYYKNMYNNKNNR